VSIDYVSQYPNHKEEMMKRLIYIIVAFMLMFIFIGYFTTATAKTRKETYDLRASVGNSPFVGESPYGVPGYGWGQLY
jgi:hypothetical protein